MAKMYTDNEGLTRCDSCKAMIGKYEAPPTKCGDCGEEFEEKAFWHWRTKVFVEKKEDSLQIS